MTALSYAASGGCTTLASVLIDAGSDLNHRSSLEWTPLHYAMYNDGRSECARLLINAGAPVDARCEAGMTPLDHCISRRQSRARLGRVAESERQRRLYPILLRAGAALPAETDDAYIRKVRAAGGIKKYEHAHLNAIAATFIPKPPRLPPELVRRVVEYAFHVGDY